MFRPADGRLEFSAPSSSPLCPFSVSSFRSLSSGQRQRVGSISGRGYPNRSLTLARNQQEVKNCKIETIKAILYGALLTGISDLYKIWGDTPLIVLLLFRRLADFVSPGILLNTMRSSMNFARTMPDRILFPNLNDAKSLMFISLGSRYRRQNSFASSQKKSRFVFQLVVQHAQFPFCISTKAAGPYMLARCIPSRR